MDYRPWTMDFLYVELKLKISLVSLDLQRFQGNDLCAVKGADKFAAADTEFALAWFDLVVLHSSRFISYCAVNPVAMYRNRGGDVAHGHQ